VLSAVAQIRKTLGPITALAHGQIDTPRLSECEPNRPEETVISPSTIADAVITCLQQPQTACHKKSTFRPAVESFDVTSGVTLIFL